MVATTALELRQGIRRIRNNIGIHTNQFHSTLIPTPHTTTTQTLHPILPTLTPTTSVVVVAAVALLVVVLRIRLLLLPKMMSAV